LIGEVKKNARKKGKQGFNEPRFWKLHQARSRVERDAVLASIERTFYPAARNYLRRELDDDLSAHGIKNQYNAFESHHYHHLFFWERFHWV